MQEKWKIYVLWIAIPSIVLIIGLFKNKVENGMNIVEASHAVANVSDEHSVCVPPSIREFPQDFFTQEERQRGYVLCHICFTAYLCLTLAIVCDQFFVPSLGIIAENLKLPVDVAGATFMAIGTSSPELYSAVIGSFVTEGDIGIGTIVGSAVFNILGVTSVTGLFLWRTEVPVDWFPISRDCLVYIFSVATLICIIQDNIVTRFEAVLLIVMFVAYIIVMVFNENIQESCKEKMHDLHIWYKKKRMFRSVSTRPRTRSEPIKIPTALATVPGERVHTQKENKNQVDNESDSDSDDDMSPWEIPSESKMQFALWLITWPALLLVTSTIPNCRKPNHLLFPYTFLSSVLWIGALSYLCSWMVTIIAHTFGLPDSVAGITLLAAGISVPEVIASVISVKNGLANMAMSNLIGSNIFDILFCLGMPWIIKTVFFSATKTVIIHSSGLAYTATTLLTTVVLLLIVVASAGWKLNFKVGVMCLALYIVFIVVACMCELNVFSNLNPPVCTERSLL